MSTMKKCLETPFTWDISDEFIFQFNEKNELIIDKNDEQVLCLMGYIMLAFIEARKKNVGVAKSNISNAIRIWQGMNWRELKEEKISIRVVRHILEATKYFVYELSNEMSMARKSYRNIKNIGNFNMDIATINGCKSIAWSTFHENSYKIATNFAEKAVQDNRNCPLWYFMLGKNYRYERRYSHFGSKPNEKEIHAFNMCYDLSDKPFYAIHKAQMLRENKNAGALNMYKNVHKSNPNSVVIQLRLALGFIRLNKLPLAKYCLDFVEKREPNNSMFLHYIGNYFEKLKNYKVAAIYYEKAAKTGNYLAEFQLATCKEKCDKSFDYINHLERMLEKYHRIVNYKQHILLHIAMQYFYVKHDFENAATNFLKAIEVNKLSEQLKYFRNRTIKWETVNIFDFVKDKLIPELERSSEFSNRITDIVNQMKTFEH